MFIQSFNFHHHLRICIFKLASYFIYFLEKWRKLRKHVKKLLNCYNAKLLSSSISSESLVGKLKSDLKQSPVNNSILHNLTKQFCYFFQVLGRVLMQKSIFIKQTMKHASINFLFFFYVRCLKLLHSLNELLNSCIN